MNKERHSILKGQQN